MQAMSADVWTLEAYACHLDGGVRGEAATSALDVQHAMHLLGSKRLLLSVKLKLQLLVDITVVIDCLHLLQQGHHPGNVQQQQQSQQQVQWPPPVGSILAFAGAGSTSTTSGNGSFKRHSCSEAGSCSSGQTDGLQQQLQLSPHAAAARASMRPASAASGLSKLSRPGSSSIETRPRPGSAATSSHALAVAAAGSFGRQQQQQLGGAEGATGDDTGLMRLRESLAQHRQSLQQWAEESAASTASLAAASGDTAGARPGSSSGGGGSNAAAGKLGRTGSRAGSRAGFATAAAAAAAPAAAAEGGCSPGTAHTAGPTNRTCSRSSSGSGSRVGSGPGTAGHSRACSYGGDLLLSSSKGSLSPPSSHASSRKDSDPGVEGAATATGDAAAGSSGDGAAGTAADNSSSNSTAAGVTHAHVQQAGHDRHGNVMQTAQRASKGSHPVFHLPLLEAGLIAPDDENLQVKVAATPDPATAAAAAAAAHGTKGTKSKHVKGSATCEATFSQQTAAAGGGGAAAGGSVAGALGTKAKSKQAKAAGKCDQPGDAVTDSGSSQAATKQAAQKTEGAASKPADVGMGAAAACHTAPEASKAVPSATPGAGPGVVQAGTSTVSKPHGSTASSCAEGLQAGDQHGEPQGAAHAAAKGGVCSTTPAIESDTLPSVQPTHPGAAPGPDNRAAKHAATAGAAAVGAGTAVDVAVTATTAAAAGAATGPKAGAAIAPLEPAPQGGSQLAAGQSTAPSAEDQLIVST